MKRPGRLRARAASFRGTVRPVPGKHLQALPLGFNPRLHLWLRGEIGKRSGLLNRLLLGIVGSTPTGATIFESIYK